MGFVGWLETADISAYLDTEQVIGTGYIYFLPVSMSELDADPDTEITITQVRLYINSRGSSPYNVKLALYRQPTSIASISYPTNLIEDLGEIETSDDDYATATLATPYTTRIGTVIWLAIKAGSSQSMWLQTTPPGGVQENQYRYATSIPYANAWDATMISDSSESVSGDCFYAAIYSGVNELTIADTATGTDSVTVTVSTTVSDTGEGTDTPGPADPSLPAIADTGAGSDAVAMVSQAATVADTGAGADAVSLAITIPTIEDTATGTDNVAIGDTGFFITDTANGADSISVAVTVTIADTAEGAESLLAPLKTVYDFGGVSYVPGAEGERVIAPIFVITDTATGTDSISLVIAIADTGAGVDTVSVTRGVITIADTATGYDAILITGQDPVTPPDAGTGGLEALHVLKLILGDKRNPTRELNLAQTGDGNIFLRTTGHTLGSGDANVLWSGQSYRFDGEKKIAESRGNANLALAYDLTAGSAAGVSAAQRQINRFFLDAKRYQEDGEGLPVYLVYRWSDNLGSLSEPVFGQLNYYWEVYHADVPRWPENIHDGRIVTGNVEEVMLNLVTSPYPEGMEQQAGFAYGDVTLDTHGVKVDSGSNSFLQWSYASTALLGQFTVEGWFTVYWGSISNDRTILHIFQGTNSLKIIYEGANNYFRITKIVAGTTYTTTSSVMALEDGDHVHVALVQDATTLRLYANGTELATVSAALFGTLSNVTIRLATNPTGPDGIDVAVDGWRIFDTALTATQAAALYNAELEVKTLGETVGPPACFDLESAEQSLQTYYRAYATVIGVSGDVEARAKWAVKPGASYGVWAGRRASRTAQASPPYLVNFNGDSYTSVTPSEGTRSYVAAISTPDIEALEGRYACLAWISNRTANGSATVKAGITLTDNVSLAATKSDGVTIGYDSNYWNLYNLGELYIRSRDRGYQPPGAIPFIEFTDVSGSPTFYIDSLLLLPWPYMGLLESSLTAGGITYVFNHDRPYGYSSSGFVSHPEVIGVPVTLVPKQYNYVYFTLNLENSAISNNWETFAPFNLYVTPRFLLPGGLIA